jgi:hypothetical protein
MLSLFLSKEQILSLRLQPSLNLRLNLRLWKKRMTMIGHLAESPDNNRQLEVEEVHLEEPGEEEVLVAEHK